MSTVSDHVDMMRRQGMSETAVRRALGLNATQAVQAGIVETVVNPRVAPAKEPVIGGGPLMVDVLTAVAAAGEVSCGDILSTSQRRGLAPLRQLTMYLLRELCPGANFQAIAHFMGFHITSVYYGCRVTPDRLQRDPKFRKIYDDARRALRLRGGTAPVADVPSEARKFVGNKFGALPPRSRTGYTC